MMFTPPYRQLGLFAGNLAMGIESALTMPRAFSIALRSLSRTPIVRAMNDPVETVRAGASIADTLRQAEEHLPAFIIPTIQAGEETGRLEESLRFLEDHCQLLCRPANVIRNAWLVPIAILAIGDVACVMLSLGIGSISGAANYLIAAAIKWAVVAGLIWLFRQPLLRPHFDRLRLRLPWYRSVEQDIANHRFFRVLSLLYGVSNSPVDSMIDTAADSVTNTLARSEFKKAADAIRDKACVTESFQQVDALLNEEQQTNIASGEQAGKLEEIFGQLADTTGDSLRQKLKLLEQFTHRFSMLVVTLSIIGVVWQLSAA